MLNDENASGDWLYGFLLNLQLVEFYDSFKNILQVTQLDHFNYVHSSDLQKIGLSGPAIARVKESLRQLRRAVGLPKLAWYRRLHGLNFGIPFLDVLKYGSPRGRPVMADAIANEPFSKIYQRTQPLSSIAAECLECPTPTHLNSFNSSLPATTCCLIAAHDVELHEGRLGSGSFGVVRRGDWLAPNNQKVPVAVKILRSNRNQARLTPDLLTKVLSEVILMQSISHPNLIRIYGVILNKPLAIVTELAPLGSLLARLRSSNMHQPAGQLPAAPATALPVNALWDIGIQLARGMAHLAANRLVHRDLAARNVLLFPPSSSRPSAFPVVKVGDFGLLRNTTSRMESSLDNARAKTLTDSPIYAGDQDQKIPFAWSSIEAIAHREFSQASDVWSWGVTIWEVWTGGAEPWAGIASSENLLTQLRAGRRLQWPRHTCPRRLFQLILACWRPEPGQRPTFAYLADRLGKTRLSEVVAMQHFDEADRMDLMAGDRVIVLDGRPENFWWRGQNRRTGEIASFPREIVRLQRGLEGQDISSPMINSFVHTGHFGADGGQVWGHLDHMDPNFLAGVSPHHADTLGSKCCTTGGASAAGSEAWRPLSSRGAGSSFGGSKDDYRKLGESDFTPGEDGDSNGGPFVTEGYDKVGDDERRILDEEAPMGSTIATQHQPLPPRSRCRFSGKDLDAASIAGVWADVYSASEGALSSSENQPPSGRPYSCSGMFCSLRQSGTADEVCSQPLIDFYRTRCYSGPSSVQSAVEDTSSNCRLPTPSAPMYQSRVGNPSGPHSTPPCQNPYFQAAWNSFMTSSPNGNFGGTRVRQAAPWCQPTAVRCETQTLVGAAPNPFPSPSASAVTAETTPSSEATKDADPSISSPLKACTNPFLDAFSEGDVSPPPLPPRMPSNPAPTTMFDPAEVDMVMKLMESSNNGDFCRCNRSEVKDALNCVVNSPQARVIIHLHTPPPQADVFSTSPSMRDWRVKAASHLLLLRRLALLDLCSDLDACWVALEKADWSVERAVDYLMYH